MTDVIMIIGSILLTGLLSFLGVFLGLRNRNKIIEENFNITQLQTKLRDEGLECRQKITLLINENEQLQVQIKILTQQNVAILTQLAKNSK